MTNDNYLTCKTLIETFGQYLITKQYYFDNSEWGAKKSTVYTLLLTYYF